MLLLLQSGEIANWYKLNWYKLHTSLPSRSTLHILQKFQWTSEQLKSVYLDLQYCHRRWSKFPAEHPSLLLDWFTLFHGFFIAIILIVQSVFWSSSFYLSVNIVVLYQFTVTCIENFASKVEAWGLSVGEKGSRLRLCFRVVDDVPEKKGMDLWKQMMSSSKFLFTCIWGTFCP